MNPTCGDEVTLRVHLEGDRVQDVSYDSVGGSISQASASVMARNRRSARTSPRRWRSTKTSCNSCKARARSTLTSGLLEDGVAFVGVAKRICGVVWARDWRRVLFEALMAPGVPVVMSAVTPPGADGLPWDEAHCAHLGPHQHGSRYGCRVDPDALAQWSLDISRRWKRLHNAARNACKREMGRCLPLAVRAWEPQKRGPGHVHPVFHLYSPDDVRVAECYLAHLARIAPKHGFGFVGEKQGKSMQIMAGDRAAAYLSGYFVTGKGRKATSRRTLGTRIFHAC